MNTFLEELAEHIITNHPGDLVNVTILFPNRRAGLFFKENIKNQLAKPVWAPEIQSFQDFVIGKSPFQIPDKLFLINRLHKTYNRVLKSHESFDRFYYWGQMLLKDFDDVDKYLVHAKNLYTNLGRQKQLDLSFDFLDDEQQALIRKFWLGFDQSKSKEKERFQAIWDRLFEVYTQFNKSLKSEGLAYEGMAYRYVAENLESLDFDAPERSYYFAGFNALNTVEDKIIEWFLAHTKAYVKWDLDAYYMNDTSQEAGHFLRTYRNRLALAGTFPKSYPQHLMDGNKQIKINGIPQHIGQAKVLGQQLGQLLEKGPELDLTKIAIVLADEAMLFPVLHSLPENVGAINVTMGFPLMNAPVNSLIEHLLELQRMYNQQRQLFHFKAVLSILRHPLVVRAAPNIINNAIGQLELENKTYLDVTDLPDLPLLNVIIKKTDDILSYLSEALLQLHVVAKDNQLENEYIHHFYQLLNRYDDLLKTENVNTDVRSFGRLFKQLIRSERLPFTGEPLRGLQIMGVLETRNLDFEYVFVLSMNEDFFPSQAGKHSFIPYNLRKAYELPNFDQQDAIYAYLFYRLIQRPKYIEFFYNTEGSDLGGEEMSRFLQQLVHESNLTIEHQVLANYTAAREPEPIIIEKTSEVNSRLQRFMVSSPSAASRLSPSAINTYLDCRLRFYLRYVAGLYEKMDMDEDVDARSLGNVLHDAMDILYSDYTDNKRNKMVGPADIKQMHRQIGTAAEKAFKKQFSVPEDKTFFFEGKNIIAREIVKQFMQDILKVDSTYAPFELIGAEVKIEKDFALKDGRIIGLRGTLDRVDKKHHDVRLIDYKTGKDKHTFKEVGDLFDRHLNDRNKAAFQTLYYALLYEQERQGDEVMVPAVFNKAALFEKEDVRLVKDRKTVKDASILLDEYKAELEILLEELFGTGQPFDQTDDIKKCKVCAYRKICER